LGKRHTQSLWRMSPRGEKKKVREKEALDALFNGGGGELYGDGGWRGEKPFGSDPGSGNGSKRGEGGREVPNKFTLITSVEFRGTGRSALDERRQGSWLSHLFTC